VIYFLTVSTVYLRNKRKDITPKWKRQRTLMVPKWDFPVFPLRGDGTTFVSVLQCYIQHVKSENLFLTEKSSIHYVCSNMYVQRKKYYE